MNGGQVSHENDPDNPLERKELEGVERLVKDAAHEGEIAESRVRKRARISRRRIGSSKRLSARGSSRSLLTGRLTRSPKRSASLTSKW